MWLSPVFMQVSRSRAKLLVEFIAFVRSGEMIAPQKDRYRDYFIKMGYLPE